MLAGGNRLKRERRVQAVGSHIWNGVHSTFREKFHEVGGRQVSKLQFSHGAFLPWRLIFGGVASGARGAILYTIIECCRRWGINPFDYLRDVLTRLPDATNWSVAELTPEKLAQASRSFPPRGLIILSVVEVCFTTFTIRGCQCGLPHYAYVFPFPEPIRKRLRNSNLCEAINKQICCRTRVAAIFPNEDSCLRLVAAILMEISDDWESSKAYLNTTLIN